MPTKYLTYTFIAVAIFIGWECELFACKCPISTTVQEHFSRADQVFIGRVVETGLLKDSEKYSATFEVIKSWKGIEEPTVRIKTEVCGPCCGVFFNTGMVYIVFSNSGETGQCSGTRLAAQVKDEISQLGKPKWVNSNPPPSKWYDGSGSSVQEPAK
jgi:hypothetical protein